MNKTPLGKPIAIAPWGTPERIAQCKRHRPSDGIDLVTGKPNGKVGCWNCGADLTRLEPLK